MIFELGHINIQSSNLNKSAIKNYARNNFNKTNPSSGNGVVPYYDFSAISGNYDCTNFVSHSLLAGGATVKGPSGKHQSYYNFHEASLYPFDEGDIVQFHNGSVWRHSTIIRKLYRKLAIFLIL